MKGGFRFQGVVGIDYDRKKDPDLFRTWNGKEAVYIFNEGKEVIGIRGIDQKEFHQRTPYFLERQKEKQKEKRQMAKMARKQNRKK